MSILLSLPIILVKKITNHLSPFDHLMLIQSKVFLFLTIHVHLDKLCKSVSGISWITWKYLLAQNQAYIGGSFATLLFAPYTFTPNDIDIYLPADFKIQTLVQTLLAELGRVGFTALQGSTDFSYSRQTYVHSRHPYKIQLIILPQSLPDNTASDCSIHFDRIICPYFSLIKKAKTFWNRRNPDREAKYIERGITREHSLRALWCTFTKRTYPKDVYVVKC
ncbi:MAG: hypothetical protein EOP45_13340 [Sphingobacteriaceae bacterium]|nr:MAG: hypothetical protein EOP45_13340 [Sphingobacteriaceae bacterium]